MAFRTWGKLLFTAFGVSVLAGAGQLGIAYGFGIVRLTGAFTDVNRWPAQLAWVGWFAVTAAVVGAVVGVRLARRVGLPDGTGAQLAVSGAAALGATVVAPLCMQPARAAELSTVDPVWAVGICAVVGAVVGAGAASAVLLRPPLGWNVALLTGAVWLIALVSVAPALLSTGVLRSVRLGVLEPSWLDAAAAQRLAMLILPAVALLAGAATGAVARWRGHVPLVSGAAGAAGPVLVAFAYLTAGPGDSADRYQLAPYYGAVIAVAAGALGSATAALLRWPLFPARGAGNAAGADDAIEPTDILRPLPDSPALSSASGDGTATVDLAGTAGAGTLPGSATPAGADRAADRAATRAATRATGPAPAHWDWPVTPGTPTPSGPRPDSGFALDAPADAPAPATWPEPSGRTPDEPSYDDLPTGRAPQADTAGAADARQPRDRRGTPESRWTADPTAPTGEPDPASRAGHRVEPAEWDAPAGSATGVHTRDGVDRDGAAARITPAVPTGEPVAGRFPAAPPAVPSDGSRAADPVQVPPTADPVQLPLAPDPVQVPLTPEPIEVPSAAVPSDGSRAADPVHAAPAAGPADAPAALADAGQADGAAREAAAGEVTPHVAVGSVAASRVTDQAEQRNAVTTDRTATAEQTNPTEETADAADRTATAEPAEATTVTPRPRPKRTRKSRPAGSDEPVAAATTSDAASTTDAGPAAATTGSAASAATTGTAAPAAAATGSAATGTAAAGTGRRGSTKRAARTADPTAAPVPADSPASAPAARSGADTAPPADVERALDRPRLDRPGLDRALDRNRLDRPELDTARHGEAGHDTSEPDAARLAPAPLDPARFDPATLDPARFDPAALDSATLDPAALHSARFDPAALDPARSEYPSAGSTRDDVRDVPVSRPGMRPSTADRIPARHTPPTAGATPATAEPAPRPRHQLPDLNSAASWNAFPAPRPAPAPPRADLPFPNHGPEEEPKPVAFRWDVDDSRPGTARTASRATDLPAAEVPGAEPRGAEPSSEVEPSSEAEPETAADRSRPKRSLFRRNKARGAEPPAESPEAEPLAAQDEEYVDWVAGLSRPLADNEPETESGRRSLRSGGRHHRD
ncbi:hypothetical protein [Micromonospora purpureochromogenes]|uniref:Uncharacterized protein n=1 Tax=Micromonospora purpureochromogenes TaxID=47872 RepID=A0ABX2RG61_9ACTN|nr:hypothetical protein [Micromonospora purpureochromogenes]NYF55281.1 hypothetical protein [Micromonospora purpureochromogenes]